MEGVLPLRLTCRSIQHKTRRAFIQRYIHTRHCWIDELSLKRLEGLSQHDSLKGSVRRIVLYLSVLNEDDISFAWAEPDSLYGNKKEHFIDAQRAIYSQSFLLNSGKATTTLTRILCNLTLLDTFVIEPSWISSNNVWPATHFKMSGPPTWSSTRRNPMNTKPITRECGYWYYSLS